MESELKSPLTPMQLELLKMFSRNVPEEQLKELKHLFVQYFAYKATKAADEVWDKEKWTKETMENFLKLHERTPYNPVK
ncbi:MAG: hypothetical protein ABI723_09010 [Bacteroidia bacterium]